MHKIQRLIKKEGDRMIRCIKQMGIVAFAGLLAAAVPAFSVLSYGGVEKDSEKVATASEIPKDDEEEENRSSEDDAESGANSLSEDGTEEQTGNLTGEQAESSKRSDSSSQIATSSTIERNKTQAISMSDELTNEDIAGTWRIDEITAYRFDENGKGALLLPEYSYKFSYTLKDNRMELKYGNSKARDTNFVVTVDGDAMTLQCIDEDFENDLDLTKE